MRKKALVLTLVLTLASTSNAAFHLVSSAGNELEPSNITDIGVFNDVEAPLGGTSLYIVIDEVDMSKGSWTGGENVYIPSDGTNTYLGYIEGYGDTWGFDSPPSADPWGVGVFTDYEFRCDTIGEVGITLYADDAVTVLDTITITQYVPEPMTIALLGLGGLFLRRRKQL